MRRRILIIAGHTWQSLKIALMERFLNFGKKTCFRANAKNRRTKPVWFQQRSYRITASTWKIVFSLGERISRNVDSRKNFFSWIKNNFWVPSNILAQDIQYCIESESLAFNFYRSNTGNKVISSGLWINEENILLAVMIKSNYMV